MKEFTGVQHGPKGSKIDSYTGRKNTVYRRVYAQVEQNWRESGSREDKIGFSPHNKAKMGSEEEFPVQEGRVGGRIATKI